MNIKSIWVIGALILAAGLTRAHASTLDAPTDETSDPVTSVLYSQSSYVQGSATTVTTLETPGAGELFLTLTDLDYPTPFTSLLFSLSNSSTALVGLADPGTLQLTVSGPTTLYADVIATAPTTSAGLYNLTATFLGSSLPVPLSSPVALPASGAMLAGALLLLLSGAYRRRLLRAVRPGRSWLRVAAAAAIRQ